MNIKAKFVIIGDYNVGKTTMTELFIYNKLNTNTMSTIGGSFAVKKIIFPDTNSMTINLWDTAGQEKFRSMISIYYRGANVIFLVFDISSRKTWESINFWYNQINSHQSEDDLFPICVLIGNKSDKVHNVSIEEIKTKAEELQIDWYILSSFDSDAVEKINNIFEQTSIKLFKLMKSNTVKKTQDIYNSYIKSNNIILDNSNTNSTSTNNYKMNILSKLRNIWCTI